MNHRRHISFLLSAAAIVAATSTTVYAADNAKPNASEDRKDKKELRVLSAPERERRMMIQRGDKAELEKETVAFLGVETGPVAAAVSTQLGLQRGMGLVVNYIVPESPAADVLKQHDILLKLDDQILIETRQLSVLIRSKKEGDEVTLTYLRGGKQATVKVKLGKQEVPKFSFMPGVEAGAFAYAAGPERVELFVPSADGEREEVDRVLSLLQRGPGSPDAPFPGFVPRAPAIRIDRGPGPGGMRAISVNTRNSNLVYSDDEGSLELQIKEGAKTLVAKNAKGEDVFSGPVDTPEQREALPAGVRARLERLEGMDHVTFRTDGDFRGAEVKTIRPRGIAFPLTPTPQMQSQPRRSPGAF